jgi:hypothetical protein
LDSKPEPRAAQEKLGRVTIQMGSPARTLKPALTPSKYELAFTGPEGASHDRVDITTGTTATVDLAPGAWTIDVTAFTGTGDAAKKAAQGSAAVTVTANATAQAAVILTPYTGEGAGTGTFGYSVTYPAGIDAGTLVVTKTDGTAVANGTVNLLEGTKKTGSLTLAAGPYKMQIRLTAKDGMIAGRTAALHIYPGLNTPASYDFTGADFVAFAEMADVSIAAIATIDDPGTAVDKDKAPEVKITLYNETFSGILTTEDLSDWITNLPKDLSAKSKALVADGDAEVTLVITGTPTEGSSEALTVTIPAASLTGGKDLTVQDNPGAKFAITLPAASAAVTAVTGLGGEEGKAFNGSITLELTNDRFTAIAADTDLKAWFKTLPAGLSAKPQAAVAAGAKTLTIAITGAPTAVAATPLEITIPGDVLNRKTALPADDDDEAAKIAVTEDTLAGFYIVGTPDNSIRGKAYALKYSGDNTTGVQMYELPATVEGNAINWEKIVFSGDDTHLVGKETISNSEARLLYQKNNETPISFKPLDTNTTIRTPIIVVDGDVVHVVSVAARILSYWKIENGEVSEGTALLPSNTTVRAWAAVVSGDYLYIAGVSSDGAPMCLKYPKNNVTSASCTPIPLSSSGIKGIAYAMTVSGEFIYLAGNENGQGTNPTGIRAGYWKIDTANSDSVERVSVYNNDNFSTSSMYGIVVSGNTVYLPGEQYSYETNPDQALPVGGYWKITGGQTTESDWHPMPTTISYLVSDGACLYIAARAEYWKINADTGAILSHIAYENFATAGIAVR